MVIARASDDDTDYIIPAAEVERIENERYRQLASAASTGGRTEQSSTYRGGVNHDN